MQCVGGGLGAEGVWQCTGVGKQMSRVQVLRLPPLGAGGCVSWSAVW